MFHQKNNYFKFLFSLFIIYIIAWIIQTNLTLNWDVSELLNAAKLIQYGGTYTQNFFNSNPPMILYLYYPVILFCKYTSLNVILTFRIYIFLLSSISFYICYLLSTKIIRNNLYIFLSTLLFTFLIIPIHHFGQRDSLLLVLSVPYVLLIAYRLLKFKINPYTAFIIGLLATAGFNIKPQFLIIPLLLETFFIYTNKKWQSIFRIETMTLVLFTSLYLLSVYINHSDYLFVILPYSLKYYYSSIGLPWIDLLTNEIMLFSYFTILLFFCEYKATHNKTLVMTLFITLISYIVSYLSQHTEFYYHLIPVFSFSILLIVLLFMDYLRKYFHIFTLLIGLIIATFILYILYLQLQAGLNYKKNVVLPLVSFMQQYPENTSIYFFTQSNYGSPLRHYFPITDNQRFDCLWMVSHLIKMKNQYNDPMLRNYIKSNHQKYFFLKLITEDIHQSKPLLIFVDDRDINTWLGQNYSHFDYINYFTEYANFKHEWKNYRYLTIITGPQMQYKLKVYQRIT